MKKPLFVHKGKVESGTETARRIGFPTANIHFDDPDITAGTYAGKVTVNGTEYRAAVYVNQERHMLESYLFDFSGDLYGKEITVKLLEKLVGVKEFQGKQDQQSFIEWAVIEVQKYFNQEE